MNGGAPDAIGVRFDGGPLDSRTYQMQRWLLEEELHIPGYQLDALLSGSGHEPAVYHRTENLVHSDENGIWVRYDHGPLPRRLRRRSFWRWVLRR